MTPVHVDVVDVLAVAASFLVGVVLVACYMAGVSAWDAATARRRERVQQARWVARHGRQR